MHSLRSGGWNEIVNGTADSLEGYVEVNWLWLILPATLVFLSFPFLIATVVQSPKAKIRPWKTSTLTTLQGLSSGLRDDLGAMGAETKMEKAAETRSARLEEGNNGWRPVQSTRG